jgi:hypothetical protein
MPKRKPDRSGDSAASKHSSPTCILHVITFSDQGHFTPLSNIKGTVNDKLQQLHEIRNKRLCLSHDSPYRMQSVCDQIPTTLPDDLESVGYHRQCYQRFTANLHLLGENKEAEASQWHHSPRKLYSASSDGPIFPPECIFCDKVEIKDGGRKTERAVVFSSWKKKENAWEQIESRAEKMGLVRLHRLVKDKDLFAVEAKHHTSCFKSFHTAFANYERGIRRGEGEKNTEHACMVAAPRQSAHLGTGAHTNSYHPAE